MKLIIKCFNIQLTGISEKTVADAPAFPDLWAEIEPIFSSGILVAHNAVFDMGVLKSGSFIFGC